MNKIYTPDQAEEIILSLGSEDCEKLALEHGSMGIMVQSERPPKHLTDGRIVDGWTLFWIPVQRNPVVWRLILGADNTRTHKIATEGRIRRIQMEYGSSRELAERYVEAARGIQFSFEDVVIRMVMESDQHKAEWDRFPGPSPAIRFWSNSYPIYPNVNHARMVAANRIIKTLWGEPEVSPRGIRTLKAYNDRHIHQIPLPQTQTLVAAWS